MRSGLILALPIFLTVLSFLACRLDSWHEVICAGVVNFVIIGPLWAVATYLRLRQRSRRAVAGAIVAYLLSASMLSLWHVTVLKARLAVAARMSCNRDCANVE